MSICPNCGAAALPSQATFVLSSTSGPVVHQTWRCAAGCWWQTYVVQPEPAAAETSALEAARRALSRFQAFQTGHGDRVGEPPKGRSRPDPEPPHRAPMT
jgi:hypothetical protein